MPFCVEIARSNVIFIFHPNLLFLLLISADDAKQILSSPTSSEKQQLEVMENLLFDGCDTSISMVNDYAPNAYGIEISDRLFWEVRLRLRPASYLRYFFAYLYLSNHLIYIFSLSPALFLPPL